MNILGEIIAVVKNQEFEGKDIEKRIKEAQFDIRERLDQTINLEGNSINSFLSKNKENE